MFTPIRPSYSTLSFEYCLSIRKERSKITPNNWSSDLICRLHDKISHDLEIFTVGDCKWLWLENVNFFRVMQRFNGATGYNGVFYVVQKRHTNVWDFYFSETCSTAVQLWGRSKNNKNENNNNTNNKNKYILHLWMTEVLSLKEAFRILLITDRWSLCANERV